MSMYHCQLIQESKGHKIVKESFYREGNSAQEVLEGLEMFEWGSGKWDIEPA